MAGRRPRSRGARHEEDPMTESATVLSLEVEEIESRERAGGSCTSSTTSRHCTCLCRFTTTIAAETRS